ncbi:DUF4112 domain-containing protein [Yoonia sp. 2307UL14-13]|uniref:DUF4112 domain-containing protein n=1 Tax=Yoonia sp. 2307UL14-13 TaxID=3126506 RepID=UPI0030B0AF7B
MPDDAALTQLEWLADQMDNLVRIPGTRVRVGLDSILGLIPGVGDVVSLAPAALIIHRSHRMGASKPVLRRMVWNTFIDALIGSIPLVGDIFDIGHKANKKNVALLQQDLEKKKVHEAAPSTHSDRAA